MIPATHALRGDGRAIHRLDAAISMDGNGRERHDRRSQASGRSGKCPVEFVEASLVHNFGEQITLRDIEKSSGYSVYQIIRMFRRRLGITPHAYLVRMRLHYAVERLLQGDTIAGAAADAGFADQSHMTRHFKRVFGTTPRQYLLDQR